MEEEKQALPESIEDQAGKQVGVGIILAVTTIFTIAAVRSPTKFAWFWEYYAYFKTWTSNMAGYLFS